MSSSPGLRERKKQKTRWTIQEHALRLFQEQGYEQTTVDQIAAAAEISPSTFFRYFRSKEDVVLQDEYDPLLERALAAIPADIPVVAAVRQALRAAFGETGPDEQQKIYQRVKLTLAVPALRKTMLDGFTDNMKVIVDGVARRTGRAPDDLLVRTFAGACFGVWFAVLLGWVEEGAKEDLVEAMDRATAALESGFAEL
jgi:AcrR family transcriptional regulator